MMWYVQWRKAQRNLVYNRLRLWSNEYWVLKPKGRCTFLMHELSWNRESRWHIRGLIWRWKVMRLSIIDSLSQTQGFSLNTLVVSWYGIILLFRLATLLKAQSTWTKLSSHEKGKYSAWWFEAFKCIELAVHETMECPHFESTCKAFNEANPQRTTQVWVLGLPILGHLLLYQSVELEDLPTLNSR